MNTLRHLRWLEPLAQLTLALATVAGAYLAREPLPKTVAMRPWLFVATLALGFLAIFWLVRRRRHPRWWRVFVGAIAASALAWGIGREWRFHAAKRFVLGSDPALVQQLGRHFIVPCESRERVLPLILRGGVGGIFLRPAFLRGKTTEQVRAEIAELQTARKDAGLPLLFVTADQEGGLVSRLSPPLPQRPSIAEAIGAVTTPEARRHAVARFAQEQGAELANLGVNVNFAPVVDLNFGLRNEADKYSLIYRRAISRDPKEVAEFGRLYCQELAKTGVTPTAKHFPGLGRLAVDTHLSGAELTTPRAELEASDWLPFREVARDPATWIMVGHAKLMAVDPTRPASISAPVIGGLLRGEWACRSVLVTDDFCMGAIKNQPGGPADAAVEALNAGVDLILLALDGDLFYPCMASLLRAQNAGRLEASKLAESAARVAIRPPFSRQD